MAKDLRRNCDNPTCGKLYRYSSAKSKYCGDACRTRATRARKAEEERAAEEARWARLREQARQIDAQIAKPEPVEADETPPPTPPAAPAEPKRKPRSYVFALPQKKTAVLTIRNVPKHFPGTPLSRPYR